MQQCLNYSEIVRLTTTILGYTYCVTAAKTESENFYILHVDKVQFTIIKYSLCVYSLSQISAPVLDAKRVLKI